MFRARVVAQGYSQKPGSDFDPDRTYTPVAQTISFCVLLTMTAILGGVFWIANMQSVYLHAPLKENLYMREPEGFVIGLNLVCKLNKLLYGLVQSTHA